MLGFIQVQSSAIEAVKYEDVSHELFVQFKSGHLYKYADVSHKEFQALMSADSLGKHFHAHIRSAKHFTKFEE